MWAADYLWESLREGIVEEWPVIKAALNTHVYAQMDTLLERVAASDPSSSLGFVAIPTVGALFQAALVLCIRKKKGGPLQSEAFGKYIEQAGIMKTLAAAPPPMQPLRALVLDASLPDRVATALYMDYRVYKDPTGSLADCITTAVVTPAMAMIDGGDAGLLIESRFVSCLTLFFERAERIGTNLLAFCMTSLNALSQKHRKVLGTDGLAQAMCDMLLKDAKRQLGVADVFHDTDRKTAVDILRSIVSYGKSLVAKRAPNPIVGQILQFESVNAMRERTSGVSQQVSDFFDALAQQHHKDTKAQPKTAISAAELAAQEAKAKRMQDVLLAEKRREKEAKAREDQKANKGKGNKGGKSNKRQQQQQQEGHGGGDEASPFDPIMEPSVPSTTASTRCSRASAADEVAADLPGPSSSIADTSGALDVPSVSAAAGSVSAAAGSDLPGYGGGAAESAADESDDSDDEDGDAMLLNSAFGLHARQKKAESEKKTKSKHSTKPTPTPACRPSQPSRSFYPPTVSTRGAAVGQDNSRHGNAAMRTQFPNTVQSDSSRLGSSSHPPAPVPAAPISSSSGPSSKGPVKPSLPRGIPASPKGPSRRPQEISDDGSPSRSESPPCRPVGGRGAGRGLMTMFAHQPPPLPSIPRPGLPSAEELRTRPSLQHTGQDDQQQPAREERPSLSTAGPSLSPFFAHAPVGPAPPAAAAAAGGHGGGGLSADPFYDSEGNEMYCVPPPPALPPPPPPYPQIDQSGFHPIGSPLPVSYNGGPRHPFNFPHPFPSSPAPAAAAANGGGGGASGSGGGGLSADPFYGYDSGDDDDMYVPPLPPIFEYEEEGYQPPSSSSAADPFAATQTAGTVEGGNGGTSIGSGAVMGGDASGSEELFDQLCRQLEHTQEEAKRRARELQEAKQKEQKAKRNEEALIRQLQEAQWTIAKMAAQQSSHHHQQHQPSSSSSSAPPPPSSSFAHPQLSTSANPTMHHHQHQQQHHDGGDYDDCDMCFGEHGQATIMYVPCRHMRVCPRCYADRKAAWQRELSRVKAENDRRRDENEVARRLNETRSQDEQISLVKLLDEPEYTCEHCKAKVEFAGTVDDCIKWVARPFK
ncbi:unnamed protein product [Vitrella brassicaformis CCMP3155]|uniref:Uncharacterized protein n=1 Tax=Vitrella brassicaformis (strain CCMP3155) TaxID=1169540 RepID=A0A0G4GKQ6_VITBC|nr:unnamed protein product [Vitrella brassicaformis CCMP3155]|eukprot:CEM30596.1 unnamed protein product [Vitrella brassicaformis CCMP3155]